MDAYRRVLGTITSDTTIVTVLRPYEFRTIRWVVRVRDLQQGSLRELPPSVLVIAVTPGGASDRAGMRVGDFIVRINGKGFKTSNDADRAMRLGASGKANTYEVMRNGELINLNVVLAEFGISLNSVIFFLVGLVYAAVGAFLGFKRPGLFSARMLALWMIVVGYFIAVFSIRREPEATAFVLIRNIFMIYSGYFGTVFAFHAALHFPWQRQMNRLKRLGLVVMYVIAFISPALLVFLPEAIAYLLLCIPVIIGLFVCPPFTREATPQQRALGRPIKIVVMISVGGALFCTMAFGLLGGGFQGIIGIFMVFLPLAYLYTIGHYRLLDLDLHVRRNVQYSLLSWLWTGLVVSCLIWTFLTLPALPMFLPHIVINGLSVEVRQELPTPEEQLAAQRAVAMILGVGVWFLLWRIRRLGQRLLDHKYYRTRFDYGRAANAIAEVLATRLSMNDIARGLVDALLQLLKVRGAAIVVLRNGQTCCCDAVAGVSENQWREVSCGLDLHFVGALTGMADAVTVDHLPIQLTNPLRALKFEYVIPIRSKGQLSGAIFIGQKLSEAPQSTEDLSFLAGVAQQVSVSIENAFLYENLAEQDRMRHELSIARQIQLDSLPSETPHVSGLDIAGSSTPALEVGGDFFDYLDGTNEDLMVIVGDVSGKGTSAALYMSKVQGILRSLHQFGLGPQELFLRANRLLCADLQKSSFITAAAALLLPHQRQVKLVRAGHLPVYIFRASTGGVDRVTPRGLGLGLSDAAVFAGELEERTQDYSPGDVIVLITDGVTEARNPSGEEYGEERLISAIAKYCGQSAQEIHEHLVADVSAFSSGADPHDDQTIVVIRVS
jgi:serine phosphatase RsbU (regulator of sigma subunit)